MTGARTEVEASPLAGALRDAVRGEVRFDAGSRALYATDASNYRKLPIGVVLPLDIDDVVAAVAVAAEHGAPVLPRGGGTSLAGQTCNTAVILDLSKHVHAAWDVDPVRRTVRVLPGTILDSLRDAVAEVDPDLTFGPDPATHNHCTLGGMIGNNSCGIHSIQSELYGDGARTADNVEELEILTYDGLRMRVGPTSEEELERIVGRGGRRGEIYARLRDLRDRYAELIRGRYPPIPRRVSGYNLDELLPERGFNVARALVGTEGTCVTVLEATLRLVPNPRARAVVVVGFENLFAAAEHVEAVRDLRPIGLEGFDDVLVQNNRELGLNPKGIECLPPGRGWLIVEMGGEDAAEAEARARDLLATVEKLRGFAGSRLLDEAEWVEQLWQLRESGLGATAFQPGKPDHWPGWEDSSVAPAQLAPYLRELRALLDRYGYDAALYGHFGQGCVHSRISFDLQSAEGIATWRRFLEEAAELVVRHGGSLSGEHGDGQGRAELLEKMYGSELVQAFREFKAIWDPRGRMNPGKVVDPAPLDADLRLGADYAPADVETHFAYPEDGGSFGHAALRCVGVGECRRLGGGTMCPSFMVTREEKHTTRGRARMLFEMMNGEEIDLWRSDEVRESLDLCLSCKGCKSDCPVSVDMATYKAEFLAHHYRRRLRPRSAYALGPIYWWTRLASRAPRLVNTALRAPVLSPLLKRAAGVARQREAPVFASETFLDGIVRRRPENRDGPRVLLWPDTFNNHFTPGVAHAGVQVLEDAGCRVVLPPRILCCGRPLYDFGMLTLARSQLRQIVRTLAPHIRAGIPMVGLEPSCVAVFRDELVNLLPNDEDAHRLSRQTFTLAEFLRNRGYRPPSLEAKAIAQGHCHHKAVVGLDADRSVMQEMGLDAEILDSGCCGMAGSFGFEEGDKYEVSVSAGERVLLPAVREADEETLILADGFSCREQIRQGTGRRGLHLAEAIRLASEGRRGAPR